MNVRIAKKVSARAQGHGKGYRKPPPERGTRYRRPTLLAASLKMWRLGWRLLRSGRWPSPGTLRTPDEHLALRRAALHLNERLLGRRFPFLGGDTFLVQAVLSANAAGVDMVGTGADGAHCRWDIRTNSPPDYTLLGRLREQRFVEPVYPPSAPQEKECRILASAGDPYYAETAQHWDTWRVAIEALPPGMVREAQERQWQATAPTATRTILVEERLT